MYGAIPGDIIGSPYGFDQGKSVSRIRFMGERRQNKSLLPPFFVRSGVMLHCKSSSIF